MPCSSFIIYLQSILAFWFPHKACRHPFLTSCLHHTIMTGVSLNVPAHVSPMTVCNSCLHLLLNIGSGMYLHHILARWGALFEFVGFIGHERLALLYEPGQNFTALGRLQWHHNLWMVVFWRRLRSSRQAWVLVLWVISLISLMIQKPEIPRHMNNGPGRGPLDSFTWFTKGTELPWNWFPRFICLPFFYFIFPTSSFIFISKQP